MGETLTLDLSNKEIRKLIRKQIDASVIKIHGIDCVITSIVKLRDRKYVMAYQRVIQDAHYKEEEQFMNFGKALDYLKQGAKLRRKGWNGKGIFIKMRQPDSESDMTHDYIYIDTTGLKTDNEEAPKDRVPWLASQTDMLADDWEVVKDHVEISMNARWEKRSKSIWGSDGTVPETTLKIEITAYEGKNIKSVDQYKLQDLLSKAVDEAFTRDFIKTDQAY